MHALQHAANAIRHAEALADEAEDADLLRAASRLRAIAFVCTSHFDAALLAEEKIQPAREERLRAHTRLGSAFRETGMRLETILGTDEASLYQPGAVLDIAERARFCLRRLQACSGEERSAKVASVTSRLGQQVQRYDDAVDRYLEVSGQYAAAKDRALRECQLLRRRLEEAKHQLLARLDPASEAHRRVKARPVRTKRARWIDAATAVAPRPFAFFTTSEGDCLPSFA